ncbi:ATP-binding protein [Rubrimonas cliftonensis]|uniref:nSTAND1 domain-containing NTPase n=1 Tax=Rubrimonas cliftonensis TaxID=89524 RepID=UPI001114FC61|nr:ATP-binding protein [Rubrimonas cliftonensis]
MFHLLDPEVGFTSAVIKDPQRFVGRTQLISNAMRAVNTTSSLIAVFGKRGVGKSSLMRQIQLIANGDYEIVTRAGLHHLIPERKRRYYTVFYTCDSKIENAEELLLRICTDTDSEDGLLRLVPDRGKELAEFTRSNSNDQSTDLKILK